MFVTTKTRKVSHSDIGERCRGCNAVLCLDGKSEVFAKRMRIAILLMVLVSGSILGGGAVGIVGRDIGAFLIFVVFVIIAFLLLIFGGLYLIHKLIIVPFCKNLGYISLSKNAKTIIERKTIIHP
jgi:hypothetical protein